MSSGCATTASTRSISLSGRGLAAGTLTSSTLLVRALHSVVVEFGGECDPREVGLDAARLATAIEQVEARPGLAQLCVIRDGRVVVDRWFGCRPDDLFWLFAASKP